MVQKAHRNVTRLAVVMPLVDGEQRVFKIKVGGCIKRQVARARVAVAFDGVVRDSHEAKCTYKKLRVQAAF